MEKPIRVILSIIFLGFILGNILLAGTAGKISGILTDKTTKEPLISASVLVKGTGLGATSDIEGRYTILNIPPGVYTLTVSYVGHRKVEVDNVRVNIDLTTTIDLQFNRKRLKWNQF